MRRIKRVTRKTGLKVIHFLAKHGESTEYRIRNGTGMHHSTTQMAISDLLATDMIQEIREEETEIHPTTKRYWLTFRGIVEFFHYLGNHPSMIKENISSVKNAVIKFNEFDEYPLFQEHNSLNSIYEVGVYRVFIDTGWVLIEAPPPLPLDLKKPHPLIQTWRSGRQREVKKSWRYLPEDCLRYSFSFVFFTFTGRRIRLKKKTNKQLLTHLDSVFGRYLDSLSQLMEDIEQIQSQWTNILSDHSQI